MKLKKVSLAALACLGFAMSAAHANEVLITADQAVKITFRVAHKNQNSQPIFGGLQSIEVNKNASIPISLDDYDLAGIIIVSMNGHELPATVNQFDQARQCSMATDKSKTTGTLEFTVSPHSISCQTMGGVFG